MRLEQLATSIAFLIATIALVTAGCDRTSDLSDTDPAPESSSAEPESKWADREGSRQIAVGDDVVDAEIAAAIEHARATLPDARLRWSASDVRDAWSVKWAAPTADASIEHVWVIPLQWNQFRVEGRLANATTRPLDCGAELGDVVSFPAEQIVDWLYAPPPPEPREGGFTNEILERHYGRP